MLAGRREIDLRLTILQSFELAVFKMCTRYICFMYNHNAHCVRQRVKGQTPSSDIFSLFPRLPIEIRLKIWEAFAHTGRYVELTCAPAASHITKIQWLSHSKPPVILRICSESRHVALAKFSVLEFAPEQIGSPPSAKLYINFASDTLYLCGDLLEAWARDLLEKNEQLRKQLRCICVKETLWTALNKVATTPQWPSDNAVAKDPTLPKAIRQTLEALVGVDFHN